MSKPLLYTLLGVCFILLILSAFFSSSESVYAKVNPYRLKRLAEAKKSRAATVALKIKEQFDKTISTILIGNSLVNIAISSIATLIAYHYLYHNTFLMTIIVTLTILIFGEILPKTLAPKHSLRLALLYAYVIVFFQIIFFPVVYVVTAGIGALAKLWTPKEASHITDEELITITEEMEEAGIIDEDDAELITNAIDMTETTAHEIMKPRVDVYAVDIDDLENHFNEITDDAELYIYSRIPVYEDTIDNIIGILNSNVLLKKILTKEEFKIRDILIPPLFFHKTKPIVDCLHELRIHKNHLAIVVDEFGGTMGILTTEDIIEELVGEIWDEADTIVPDYIQVSENVYLVDGDMNIYDFLELVDYPDKEFETEYTTVGGWCTEILERFPEAGDTFNWGNLHLEIVQAEQMRVEKVRVTINQPQDEENELEN